MNDNSLPEQCGENPHIKEIMGLRDLDLEGDPLLVESWAQRPPPGLVRDLLKVTGQAEAETGCTRSKAPNAWLQALSPTCRKAQPPRATSLSSEIIPAWGQALQT